MVDAAKMILQYQSYPVPPLAPDVTEALLDPYSIGKYATWNAQVRPTKYVRTRTAEVAGKLDSPVLSIFESNVVRRQYSLIYKFKKYCMYVLTTRRWQQDPFHVEVDRN